MPYRVQSRCARCGDGDVFVIGHWTVHLGVHICSRAQAVVNVPVDTGTCPGCGDLTNADELYDYSFAIPYLSGQSPRSLEAGPPCPKCQSAPLTFDTVAHLSLGLMVMTDAERARATWGHDYLEKSIFMNSSIPVIEEFHLDPDLVFEYFNLHLPTGPIATKRVSYPILLDIRTHLWTLLLRDRTRFARTPRRPASQDSTATTRQIRRRRQ